MFKGLMHSHSGMGLLLLVVALINIALALSASKNPSGLSKIMRICHVIVLMGGRFNILLGIALFVIMKLSVLSSWQYMISIFLWGGAEVAAKRLVKPELQSVGDGISPTKNLLFGFLAELGVLILIFLCMYYK